MTDAGKIWNLPSAVRFFVRHRNKREDLYRSEAQLFPEFLTPGSRILDVGCAAGGLLAVLQEARIEIDYTGVDCSALMAEEARRRFPGFRFEVADGSTLPFEDSSFDLVICTGGTLVTNLNWRNVLQECWRVTADKFLFDLRVTEEGKDLEDIEKSWVRLAFDGDRDDAPVAPYVIVSSATFYQAVMSLGPVPAHITGVGYYHLVSEMATTPHREVCMLQVGLAKHRVVQAPALQWNVPFPWPDFRSHPTRT